jgi:hypothetical protein
MILITGLHKVKVEAAAAGAAATPTPLRTLGTITMTAPLTTVGPLTTVVAPLTTVGLMTIPVGITLAPTPSLLSIGRLPTIPRVLGPLAGMTGQLAAAAAPLIILGLLVITTAVPRTLGAPRIPMLLIRAIMLGEQAKGHPSITFTKSIRHET